jgi:hypothetical protein
MQTELRLWVSPDRSAMLMMASGMRIRRIRRIRRYQRTSEGLHALVDPPAARRCPALPPCSVVVPARRWLPISSDRIVSPRKSPALSGDVRVAAGARPHAGLPTRMAAETGHEAVTSPQQADVVSYLENQS